jgi:hypothetical protein
MSPSSQLSSNLPIVRFDRSELARLRRDEPSSLLSGDVDVGLRSCSIKAKSRNGVEPSRRIDRVGDRYQMRPLSQLARLMYLIFPGSRA